jgi:hypothetical protein
MDTIENKKVVCTEGEKLIKESLEELFKIVKFELRILKHEVECLKKWFVNTHLDDINRKLENLIDENNNIPKNN